MADVLIQFMEQKGIPVTLENYVNLNWLGEKAVDDLDDEDWEEIPPELMPDGGDESGDSDEPEDDKGGADDDDDDGPKEEEADLSGGPKEVAPKEPEGPKVVLKHGSMYDFMHHHPESGVAVRARGKLSRWGRAGATLVSEDGQEHKVPWSSLSPAEKKAEAKKPAAKKAAKPKAKPMKKADEQADMLAKSDVDPLVVFAAATAAEPEAKPEPETPSVTGVPAPEQAEAEPKDERISYAQKAIRAVRNFWNPK